ncbi:accessory gene regulator ArgB-like protein [Paenibacillus sinopodophylli]|uniref:accessory gene regulator ArgB-like protein n=1 Tax=Paenibacillus sinopodophylli TaxID=1837342 RepID=UPI00110CAF2C|nr:accessory gene regulator B family protein [Paenibacillus sinopodophylli]
MIEAIASSIAVGIKKVVPEHPSSVAVLQYSLALILNGAFIIGLSLLLSIITGKTAEVAIILISFALLRQVSGGLHLKSGMSCVLVSTGVATVLSLVNLGQTITLTITAISMLLMLLLAPSNIEKQSRIPKRYYPILKAVSVVIVAVNLLIQSDVIALAFIAQGITLILTRR